MKRFSFCVLMVICVLAALASETKSTEAKKETAPALTPAAEATPAPQKLGKWQQFWLDYVEKFRAENATLDPDQKYIVFLGDSLTQGFKVEKFFPDMPVLNRGIGSDGVAAYPSDSNPHRGVTQRMKESVYDCNPSHVFFLIGTNDVGNTSIPIEYWQGAHKYVIQRTRAKFPDVKIILITCPPTGSNYKRHEHLNARLLEWNEIVKQTAKEENCRVIDLYTLLKDERGMLPDEMSRDGLHFNDSGREIWAKAAKEILAADGVIKAEQKPEM